MRIHGGYLKRFVNFAGTPGELRDLLVSVGIEVASVTPLDGENAVLDIEITPNRPDWLSHWGVARDLAARIPGGRLTLPDLQPPAETAAEPFTLEIEDPADCPRFTGCLVKDVAVAPSSPALVRLLEELGQRPINNLVDISNLVMLTTGQPLHFYDRRLLRGDTLRARRAVAGERVTLLDGTALDVGPAHLVIADAERPVGLAGIMGGLDTGVSPSTRDLFIECAAFAPTVIRRTARGGNLRTEASYRYERGCDVGITPRAVALALQWIETETRQPARVTWYRDLWPRPTRAAPIRLAKGYPAAYIGIELKPDRVEDILRRLGFDVQDRGDAWEVTAPTFRVDISVKQDLVEEVARLHGYDKLGSAMPPIVGRGGFDRGRDRHLLIKQHLASTGFHEAINYAFQSPGENRLFSPPENAFVGIQNPLGSDFSVLRNSLLGGLLRNTAHNLHQGAAQVCLFETGKTFDPGPDGPRETERLAVIASGDLGRADWRTPRQEFDIFAFKSILGSLLSRLGIDSDLALAAPCPGYAADACFRVLAAGRDAGRAGRLDDEAGAFFRITQPVFAAELELAPLLAAGREPWFAPWSVFPATRRDFSFLIRDDVAYEQLQRAIEREKPAELESYELMDRFAGEAVPPGTVSLSLAFVYRANGRTLSGDEVNDLHRALTARLCHALQLVQR